MAISRRKFIQLGSLASAAFLTPNFLQALGKSPLPLGDKKLIVIQLSGGNDGLNTVIPFRNDIYYSNRKNIAIPAEKVLSLTDEVGLHPSLSALKGLYDEGELAVINGVGYPQPDRSHFRSMDIWQTGSGADEIISSGWIGRYLDSANTNGNTHNALAIEADETMSLALKGTHKNGIALQDIKRFYDVSRSSFVNKMSRHAADHDERLAGYLYKTLTETTASADYLYQQSKLYNTTQVYPDHALGKRLKMIGQLINSGAETKVFYVSHGSFDTHVNQNDRQENLFNTLNSGLSALIADLKAHNTFNDVLIMTFSEFGRRVEQNASNGTDHGAANCMFMISGGLKKAGIFNTIPNLTTLADGDLEHSIDFRRVYATVLDNWLGADPIQVLGRRFEKLNIV